MKRLLTAISATVLSSAIYADRIDYEKTISSPADDGVGPVLWYRSADTRSNNDLHILNSGSAGLSPSTYQAQLLGVTLYKDLWGNANMAFGTSYATASVAGSTGLFATGAQGTVSFLFKTEDTIPSSSGLFLQGASFSVKLHNTGVRIDHRRDETIRYTEVASVKANTWYFFAMKWDTTKSHNNLTWYLSEENGRLRTGALTIDSAGEPYTPVLFNQAMVPMQQIAVWNRELSHESIQSQFKAIVNELREQGHR